MQIHSIQIKPCVFLDSYLLDQKCINDDQFRPIIILVGQLAELVIEKYLFSLCMLN